MKILQQRFKNIINITDIPLKTFEYYLINNIEKEDLFNQEDQIYLTTILTGPFKLTNSKYYLKMNINHRIPTFNFYENKIELIYKLFVYNKRLHEVIINDNKNNLKEFIVPISKYYNNKAKEIYFSLLKNTQY